MTLSISNKSDPNTSEMKFINDHLQKPKLQIRFNRLKISSFLHLSPTPFPKIVPAHKIIQENQAKHKHPQQLSQHRTPTTTVVARQALHVKEER